MKKHLGMALLFLSAAGIAPMSASAGTEPGGWPAHSGFYFNTDVAPAAMHVEYSGPHDNMDVRSGGANVDFRFGYALTRNLVLSLDLNGEATVNKPDTTLNGNKLYSSTDYHFASAMVGAGLTWYFDNNLFLGFTVGSGQVTLHYDNTDFNSDNGFATQLRVGKEWWIGHDWGLGVVGGYDYVSANTDTRVNVFGPSGTYTAYFDHADARAFFIGFTATFN